ncbi:unnamed protein product [Leuciscus chuanchicus]
MDSLPSVAPAQGRLQDSGHFKLPRTRAKNQRQLLLLTSNEQTSCLSRLISIQPARGLWDSLSRNALPDSPSLPLQQCFALERCIYNSSFIWPSHSCLVFYTLIIHITSADRLPRCSNADL